MLQTLAVSIVYEVWTTTLQRRYRPDVTALVDGA